MTRFADTDDALAALVGRALRDIPDETDGHWPIVDSRGIVTGWLETWEPGEYAEFARDGVRVWPDEGCTDYVVRLADVPGSPDTFSCETFIPGG